MTIATQRSASMPRATMATLMLAVFTVSIGFGIMLPLLPSLIERLLGAGVEAAQISRHTGLLTGVYTFALFLFAPVWGRLSDRYGPRVVLLVGLLGFSANMLVFSFIESLPTVYAERFLSGMFAAAVMPVAVAAIGGFPMTERGRARRLAFVTMASIGGFLLGPMLSVYITRFAAGFLSFSQLVGSVAIPLAATALLAFFVSVAVVFAVPGRHSSDPSKQMSVISFDRTGWLMPKLFILTFIVSAGIGVFDLGLTLRGKQELSLTSHHIALMFTECSLVMFVMQAIVFSPWFRPESTRWLIAPALCVVTAGLFLVPWASNFTLMLVVIGAVAASAGILSPILTYWISAKAGNAQGWELGKQTAVSNLGITVGSAVGGLLFNVTALPGAAFFLTAGLVALGFLLSLGLSHLLVARNLGGEAFTRDPT